VAGHLRITCAKHSNTEKGTEKPGGDWPSTQPLRQLQTEPDGEPLLSPKSPFGVEGLWMISTQLLKKRAKYVECKKPKIENGILSYYTVV
jgi:hypothetical protein